MNAVQLMAEALPDAGNPNGTRPEKDLTVTIFSGSLHTKPRNLFRLLITGLLLLALSCKKDTDDPTEPIPEPKPFRHTGIEINGRSSSADIFDVPVMPQIRVSFQEPLDLNSAVPNIQLRSDGLTSVDITASLERGDSVLVIRPRQALDYLTRYSLVIGKGLKSRANGALQMEVNKSFITSIDSSDKFTRISDEELLDLVQKQTLKYFYDFGHPVSGLARERKSSGDLVTTGGSGFGVMAMIVGIERGFITRAQGLERIGKMVDFLKTRAARFHGAYPHWLMGNTGEVLPFSQKDDGADLVETSLLLQGLITARQYFTRAEAAEKSLREDITEIYEGVEWDWFRKNDEQVLYWHWSPNHQFDINLKVQGWNETLITYLLAAASPTHSIPKSVYDNGFARNGAMKNGNQYYGINLPLGPAFGGPLFFSHYSFLGLNPNGLSDAYAKYWDQNLAHTKINYQHALANPKNYNGYSESIWGLTASDNDDWGYAAHAPNNDLGIISPTAAISSMPYTPEESMRALRFFYYTLGDRIWKEYGFVDAFNLSTGWFANSFLAINQGPIIIMIENHRSGLLWDLFMSAPEVKAGLKKLGFQSPYL